MFYFCAKYLIEMIMKKQLLAFGVGLLAAASVSAQDLSTIQLNTPSADRGKSIMMSLRERHSDRVFDTKELSLQDLSDLLWAANGVNRPGEKKRTAPSAMNKQEIDLYVFTKDGVYKYDAFQNTLQPVASGDHRNLIAGAQDFVLSAPVSLLMVADLSKFGGADEHSRTVGAADAGIVSQNINLFCAGVGLSTVPRASMDQKGLKELLKLNDTQVPMLNNPVGYPK